MKILIKALKEFKETGRWDIDFHLPPKKIKIFPPDLLRRVDSVADIAKNKRNPEKEPDKAFHYIDISSIDVSVGMINNPQILEGSEAPSRARKVVRAYDVIISTCRPTRGAIAVVPIKFHDQIASTGFSIIRPHSDVNPFYLHYALRLPSTLEQFRKWSTGSSYPAILDSDVEKTLIPIPTPVLQDEIAAKWVIALYERNKIVRNANYTWASVVADITSSLSVSKVEPDILDNVEDQADKYTISEIKGILDSLPPITCE
jgi:type I restriction enzyme S subunit